LATRTPDMSIPRLSDLLGSSAPRFLVVGATCTVFQYSLLVVFIEWFGLPKVFSSGATYALSTLLNYELSRRFTFRAGRATARSFVRFVTTSLIGLTLNTLLFRAALGFGVPHYLVAQVFATGTVMVVNYLLYRHWSFAARK